MQVFIALFLNLSVFAAEPAANLKSLVDQRIQKLEENSPQTPSVGFRPTLGFEGLVPIQSIEYQYGFDDQNDRDIEDFRTDEKQRHGHTIRFNLKSFKEMSTFWESRRLSDELLRSSRLEVVNQKRYEAYVSVVQQVIYYRMVRLLDSREKNLSKSVEQSSQYLGLSKIDVKDLIGELNRLHKASSEGKSMRAQAKAFDNIGFAELSAISDVLVQRMNDLGEAVGKISSTEPSLAVQRKQVELNLEKINREVNWADDTKLINSFDLRYQNGWEDTRHERDTGFRISFNFPIRFDRENRSRERALRVAQELDFERQNLEMRGELERKKLLVQGLAAQGESTRERFRKALEMHAKVKRVKDVELRRVLDDFGFELERDVLVIALKFYAEYLEYLQQQGYFARHEEANFLDPHWVNVLTRGG